jgi:hypothetical protein
MFHQSAYQHHQLQGRVREWDIIMQRIVVCSEEYVERQQQVVAADACVAAAAKQCGGGHGLDLPRLASDVSAGGEGVAASVKNDDQHDGDGDGDDDGSSYGDAVFEDIL